MKRCGHINRIRVKNGWISETVSDSGLRIVVSIHCTYKVPIPTPVRGEINMDKSAVICTLNCGDVVHVYDAFDYESITRLRISDGWISRNTRPKERQLICEPLPS